MGLKKNPATVLLISSSYSPENIGIGRYSTDLASIICDSFDEAKVTVLCENPNLHFVTHEEFSRSVLEGNPDRTSIKILRAKVRNESKNSLLGRVRREISFLLSGLQVLFSKKNNKPSLVACIIPKVSGAIIGIVIKKMYRVPLILIVQDVSSSAITEVGLTDSKLLTLFAKKVEEFSIKIADRVICISDQMADYLGSEFGINESKLNVIPNYYLPVTGSKVDPTLRRRDKFIILYSGSIGLKHDLDIVGLAAELLLDYSDVEFHIFCSGEGYSAIETMLMSRPNVIVRHLLPDLEYAKALNEASVFLISEKSTLRNMCLPSKLTTYLAFEKPVISVVNPDGATAAFLGDASILVPPGASEELVKAVLKLRNDEDSFDEFVKRTRLLFRSKMNRDEAIKSYYQVLYELRSDKFS